MATIYTNSYPTDIANTKAALASYVTVDASGALTVDEQGLMNWLTGQFDSVISSYAIDQPYARQMLDMNAVKKIVADLKAAVSADRWKSDPNWPLTGKPIDKETQVAAVNQAQVDALKITHDIIYHYEEIAKAETKPFMESYLNENLLDLMPKGVTRIEDTRSYVATFVTDWDEESAPSDPSELITIDQNDTVTVSVSSAPLGRHINRIRIYRSNTGNESTAFQFVSERTIATDGYTFTDDVVGEELGESCPTLTWAEPHADMIGVVAMPGGITLGFRDRVLTPSEAFVPYAYPREYEIPLDFPIVGLGVLGQSAFVGTRGNPYIVTGTDPANLSTIKLDSNQACVSKRSIATVTGGVIYASPDGLCLCDGSSVRVVSEKWFNRDDWQALVPSSIKGVEHEGVYYAIYNTGTVRGCFAFDFQVNKLWTLPLQASTLYVDRATDSLYAAFGQTIYRVFGGITRRTGRWRSKVIRLDQPQSMSWLHVDAVWPGSVTVRIFVEGSASVWYSVAITGPEPVRLPPGIYTDWQIEVEASIDVLSVMVASTTEELNAA